MKGLVVLLLALIASMTGVYHRALGSSDDTLQQIWKNDVTPEGCTDIARGWYIRNGARKPFTLLRKSQNVEEGAGNTQVSLSFMNPQGDSYLIRSQFYPEIDKMTTFQFVLIPTIDPDRPRATSSPMYEELRETNLNPLFLMLAIYLAKKYQSSTSNEEEVVAVLKKSIDLATDTMLRLILPYEIVVRVERRSGHVAPIEVVMHHNDAVISTIRMKNAMVNNHLRPFWLSLEAQGKRDEIFIDSWGTVKDNHEYFTLVGLGRGYLSPSLLLTEVKCPPEICVKNN